MAAGKISFLYVQYIPYGLLQSIPSSDMVLSTRTGLSFGATADAAYAAAARRSSRAENSMKSLIKGLVCR